jgi:predicted acetyltransferase
MSRRGSPERGTVTGLAWITSWGKYSRRMSDAWATQASVTTEYELRLATDNDWPNLWANLSQAFHDDGDEESADLERSVFEPSRSVVATQGGAIAGMVSAFTRDLTVPGGVVPAAHVTMVNVGATHRRRGLLRQMIDKCHADSIALGEPVAVLYASEGRIYQRFGYGLATRNVTIEANTNEVKLRDDDPDDGLRAVPPDSLDVFQKVFEEARIDRPGWSSRDERWWRYQTTDIKAARGGATSLRAAVHDGPSGVDGYVLWRAKSEWTPGGPNGKAIIREMVATTPEAYRAIWRFAFNVDLTRSARYRYASIDEPVQFLVNEPRWLEMKLTDGLWVRLLDVPAALAARRYVAPVDVVIEVDDPQIAPNAGRFRLVGDEHRASCSRTDAPADIATTAHALGAAYLGGSPLTALADGGEVRELRGGSLARVSVAFGWHRAPNSIEMF